MEEYRFDGSACEFLEAMKYILIARQMYKDNRKDLLDVLTNPDKVEEVSDEYGMDDYVLIKEHHFTTYANSYIDAKAAVSVPL